MENAIIRGINFSNKGAEAMALTISQFLIEDLEYNKVLLNCDPPSYRNILSKEITFCTLTRKSLLKINNLFYIALKLLQPFYLKLFFNDFKTTLEIILVEKEQGGIKALFDAAGFSYSDECAWGARFSKSTKIWSRYCKQKNIPIIFLPQSWGPFEEIKETRKNVTKFLKLASLVFARDHKSLAHLSELDLKSMENIHFSNDIVNLFNDYFPITHHINGHSEKVKKIGISPNARIPEKERGEKHYTEVIISLIKTLSLEYEVTLFPNELDDLKIINEISATNPDLNCHIVTNHLSVFELRDLIRSFDIVISSRFHCLVFSLSNNIPSVSIGWSHKYKALFSEYDLNKFNFTHDNLDLQEISSSIFEIKSNYNNYIKQMEEKNSIIYAELKTNIRKIVDILK